MAADTAHPRDLDAIKAKIKALLAKTTANGCTEAEAMAAAEKAFAMLKDYGLTEAELHLSSACSTVDRRKRQPIDDLWLIVALVCRCKIILSRPPGRSLGWMFVGFAPWPEVADWLLRSLEGAHTRAMAEFKASPEYQRRRTTKTRAAARRNFTAGFIDGVKPKLFALVDSVHQVKMDLTRVEAAAGRYLQNTKAAHMLGQPNATRDGARDRGAGAAAGLRTPVNWAVQSSPAAAIAGPRTQRDLFNG